MDTRNKFDWFLVLLLGQREVPFVEEVKLLLGDGMDPTSHNK